MFRKSIIVAIALIIVIGACPFAMLAAENGGVGEVAISPQSIYINGEKANLTAYLINGSNYFKLRDIGQALDFGVDWDSETQSVQVDSSKPYTPAQAQGDDSPDDSPDDSDTDASEGATDNASSDAIESIGLSAQRIYIDGELTSFTAYLINGSNYFKLRDIGQALNFGVDWDSETQSVQVDSSKPYTPPRPPGPDVPARDMIGDDFFSDAAVIGNSLVDGFRLYSGLDTCDIFAATSLSVFGLDSARSFNLRGGGAGTVYEALASKSYGKVYILLGINEIGSNTASFIDTYAGMLDRIVALQPDADIYIMSLTPVSAAKSSSNSTFTKARVTEYNAALYELAKEKACFYIDLVEALGDEDGYLPARVSWDGVHFEASHYRVWADYLRTHYVR